MICWTQHFTADHSSEPSSRRRRRWSIGPRDALASPPGGPERRTPTPCQPNLYYVSPRRRARPRTSTTTVPEQRQLVWLQLIHHNVHIRRTSDFGLPQTNGWPAARRARYADLVRRAYLLVGGDVGAARHLTQTALERTYFAGGVKCGATAQSTPTCVRRCFGSSSTRGATGGLRERPFAPDEDLPDSAETARSSAVDDRITLERALRSLTSSQRAVLVLRYWDGLSVREVANTLECSESTVKTHCSRAVARLRTDVSLRDYDRSNDG